jgi:hypothetical protein
MRALPASWIGQYKAALAVQGRKLARFDALVVGHGTLRFDS